AGWGTICESYFPTNDYPEMYTDETSCITAGYYWDGVYCTYYPQEVQIYSTPPSYYNIFSLGSFQFNAYNYINGDVTTIAAWDSNDSSIAYVNSTGVMSAVSSGYTTISATYNNYTANQIVKIHDLSVYSDIVDGVYQYSDLNASDMKVYRIILSEPAVLTLGVTSPGDPVVAVYDKNQTLLAYNDDYSGLNANLSVNVLDSEYFIGVTGYSAQALSSYELTVDTSPIPFVSVLPSQISFGDIPLYGYAEQNVTIENNSTVDLYLNNISLEYYDAMTAFNSQCPLVLAPYASCSVSVGVSPTYTGAYVNSVIIDTGVSQGLIYIPVSANGVDYNTTTVYLTGISISPLNQEVEIGNSILFNAYANYSDSTSLDITNQAIWSAEYGTITNGEYTTGNTIGDDFVTAAFEQFSLTFVVKVVDFNNTTIQDCTTDIA
ncbi:MAG: hypothetical protein QG567_1086, partial [Campylobacterota bacterium]|nr:hypothetical protein [Campylobacterota bacterium]